MVDCEVFLSPGNDSVGAVVGLLRTESLRTNTCAGGEIAADVHIT